jgi:phospholipase/carboxylesterase
VQDPVVPLSLARTSKATLVSHGFQVEWHEYPMQHAVCGEEIETIAAWLEKRFRSPILLAR